MPDFQILENNSQSGSNKSWVFKMTPKGLGIIVQVGSQDKKQQAVAIDIQLFDYLFNRHPFLNAMVRSMNRDIWERGFDKKTVFSRLDQIVRAAEGLKKGEPARMTEKTHQRFAAIKKDLDIKKASMSEEEYRARGAKIEKEVFFKHFPKLLKGFKSEEAPKETAPLQPWGEEEEQNNVQEEQFKKLWIIDKHIGYGTVIDGNTKPPFKFHIDAQSAFQQCDAVNLFPNTDFGNYIIDTDRKFDEVTPEVRLRESDVVRFQIFFGLPYFFEHLTEKMKAQLRQLFESVERCTQMIKLMQFYADLKKTYWRFAMIDVMLPILYYDHNSVDVFFTGGDIDLNLDGKAEFKTSPWFSLNGNTISINEKAVESDLTKFWEYFG